MPDFLSVVVIVALVVVALLVVAALVRMGSIAGSRDAVVREAADLRTRLEMLAATSADFERDLRQDLANARAERACGPSAGGAQRDSRPASADDARALPVAASVRTSRCERLPTVSELTVERAAPRRSP